MASDTHLAKLKEGPEAWNAWRRGEPSVRPDLQGLSLSLAQKQWGETNGGPINLAQAVLRDANLRHATLNRADLSGALLSGANLTGARLKQADLRNAILANARFDDADLQEAILQGADIRGADLRSARNLDPSQIETTRGDVTTLLPAHFEAPRTWAGAGPGIGRSAKLARSETPAETGRARWSGSLARSPSPQPAKTAPAKPSVTKAAAETTKLRLGGIFSRAANSGSAAAPAEKAKEPSKSLLSKPAAFNPLAAPVRAAKAPLRGLFSRAAPAEPAAVTAPVETSKPPSRSVLARPAAHNPIATAAQTSKARGREAFVRPALRNPFRGIVERAKTRWRAALSRVKARNPLKAASRRVTVWWSSALARYKSPSPLEAIAERLEYWWEDTVARFSALPPALGFLRRPQAMLAVAVSIVGLVVVVFAARHFLVRDEMDAATLKENALLGAEARTAAQGTRRRPKVGGSNTAAVEDAHKQVQVLPVAKAGDRLKLLDSQDAPTPPLPTGAVAGQRADHPIDATPQAGGALKTEEVRSKPVKAAEASRYDPSVAAAIGGFAGPPETRSSAIAPVTPKAPVSEPAEAAKPAAGESTAVAALATEKSAAPAPAKEEAAAPAAAKEEEAAAAQVKEPVRAPPPTPVQKKIAAVKPAAADTRTFAADALQSAQAPKTVVEYLRTPKKSTEWVKAFIQHFYLSSSALEEDDIQQIYAEPLDYFGKRKTSLGEVAREKSEYYRHWPNRHYALIPGSISVDWKSPDVADVTFLYDFDVSAPHKKANKGRGRAFLTLDLSGGAGRIVREDGEVIGGE